MNERDALILAYELRERAQQLKHRTMVNVAYCLESIALELEQYVEAGSDEKRRDAETMAGLHVRLSYPMALKADEKFHERPS